MGHLINPISFRLGASKHWNSLWSVNSSMIYNNYSSLISQDIIIFNLIKLFTESRFFKYSSIIISHIKILRQFQNIIYIIYFYNGTFLHNSMLIRRIYLNKFFQKFLFYKLTFINLLFFIKYNSYKLHLIKTDKLICQNIFFKLFKYLNNFYKIKLNITSFLTNYLFKFLTTKLKYIYFLYLTKNRIYNYKIKNSFKYFFSNHFSILVNANKNFLFFYYIFNLIVPILLNDYYLILLILYKLYFKLNKLINFYYYKLVIYILIYIKIYLNKINKINYNLIIKFYYNILFNKSFLYFFSEFLFYIYKIKIPLEKYLYFYIGIFLQNYNFKITWKLLNKYQLTASIIAQYICIKLRKRFRLKEILIPTTKFLIKSNFIKGFKITCSGRFTKKEIATYDVKTYSSIPFNSISSILDYNFSQVILKYSLCGVKVFLNSYYYSRKQKKKLLFNYIIIDIVKYIKLFYLKFKYYNINKHNSITKTYDLKIKKKIKNKKKTKKRSKKILIKPLVKNKKKNIKKKY